MPYTIPDSVLELINQRMDADDQNPDVDPFIQPQMDGDGERMDAPDYGLPYNYYNYAKPELDREDFAEQPWVDKFIPLDPRQAPGIQTIECIRSTYSGQWRLMNDYKNNISRTDVQFQRILYGNKRFSTTFEYTNQDRDRDKLSQGKQNPFAINIVSERRYAARESWRQLRNQLFSVGKPEIGIFGAFTHPDVPRAYSTFRPDLDASPDDNLKLLIRSEARIARRTKQRELATTVIMPPDIYRELSQQPYILLGGSSVSRTTLEQFLHASVSIKEADFANELEGVGPNGEDAILFYTRNPRKLAAMTPLNYREDAPVRGTGKQTVLCEGEVSGVHYSRPFSAEILFVPTA